MQNRNLQNMIRELEFRPESNPGFSHIEQAKIDGQAEDMWTPLTSHRLCRSHLARATNQLPRINQL